MEKTFTGGSKTVKFVNIFSLESFPLCVIWLIIGYWSLMALDLLDVPDISSPCRVLLGTWRRFRVQRWTTHLCRSRPNPSPPYQGQTKEGHKVDLPWVGGCVRTCVHVMSVCMGVVWVMYMCTCMCVCVYMFFCVRGYEWENRLYVGMSGHMYILYIYIMAGDVLSSPSNHMQCLSATGWV